MVMLKNGTNEPLIPDKNQMKRVLHLLQSWYKYKDPFTDKSITGKQAEAISNVYLRQPTMRPPLLKHSDKTGILKKKFTTVHNIHDDPETTSNSLVSDEEIELYLREDEEDFTLNVSDSETSSSSDGSDSALLDIDDERRLMV